MRRDTLFALVGLSAVGLIVAGKASASFAPWGFNSDPLASETGNANQDTLPPLENSVAAFLATIRQLESGDDYLILNGGKHFSDMSRHPATIAPPGTSTAAGAYQITWPTWQDFGSGEFDFSPEAQDRVAYLILGSTGAVDALADGQVDEAIRLASRRWQALSKNSRTVVMAAYDMNIATA